MFKLICKKCGSIYYYNCLDKKYRDICPKSNCNGELIELDDLMILPIIELNKKGYHTSFCCSGHYYESSPSPYIKFDKDLPMDIEAPNNWYIEDDDRKFIRAEYAGDNLTSYEKYKYILDCTNQLMEWVEGLIPLK